jgi:hypothetical protein
MRVWRAGAFGVAARRPARAAAVRPRDAAAALSRADVVAARGVGRRNGDGARAGQRMGAGCMSIRFMSVMVDKGGLKVDDKLVRLVERDIAPGTGVDPEHFWAAFGKLVLEEAPRNKALLDKRDQLQQTIDDYHAAGKTLEMAEYKKFLSDIGYLVPEGAPFKVGTSNVDPEIGSIAGPQLVCPVDNPRFILNAANARW